MFTAAGTELEKGDTVKKKRRIRLILVSLSAFRLSFPSVDGKIFTRFVDRLSFEFALSILIPRRTSVLSFKCSSWKFSPYDFASRQYALRASPSFWKSLVSLSANRQQCCPVFSEEKPTFRVGLWTFFLKVIPHSCLWQTCCARQYALRTKKKFNNQPAWEQAILPLRSNRYSSVSWIVDHLRSLCIQ